MKKLYDGLEDYSLIKTNDESLKRILILSLLKFNVTTKENEQAIGKKRHAISRIKEEIKN